MSRSILTRIQILVVITIMATAALLTPVSSMGLDVAPSGFFLEEGDILVFDVVETSEDGVPGLTIELENNGESYNTSLDAGEEIGMRISELPDWGANTSELALVDGSTNGGDFNLEYPAPYLESGEVGEDGPPYFMPVITIGDDAYWNDFETVATGNNFTVTQNATHFYMTETTADDFLEVSWTKSDGVMSYYRYEMNDQGVDKVLALARADWDVILSQASILGFSTTDPLLDYTVTEAEFGDLNNAFDFSSLNISEDNEENEGPIDADGMFYVGDRIQAQIDEHRMDDVMGYLLGLQGPNGYIDFNISINFAQENPQESNMLLYPQFIVTDDEIIDGYLHVAEFMSEDYSTFMNDTHFGIAFDHENGTIDVEWEKSTGFMTSWRLNNSEEGQVLALELFASADLNDFNVNWDHVIANEGNTYQFLQINAEGENQLQLDNDDTNPGVGYIGEGDLVYVNPVSSSVTLDDTPPTVFYDINATNGHQQNISISVQYPGFDNVETEGPPLLYFHHLGGSSQFFEWVELLYDSTGGSYAVNGTHIVMSFTNANVTWQQVFRVSDYAMVYYYYENIEIDALLEIIHFSDVNDVVSDLDTETPAGLELPLFDGFTGIALMALFIAIPILRRR